MLLGIRDYILLISITFAIDLELISGQACSSLSDPVYGSVSCNGNQMNDRCEFKCDRGYALSSQSSSIRRCVCFQNSGCFWTGNIAACNIVANTCPQPMLAGTTYNLVDLAPIGAIARVTVSPTINSIAGWSVIVIFSSPLDVGTTVGSYAVKVGAISADRKAVTFTNRGYNMDISRRQQYAFTFYMTGSNLMAQPNLFAAMVGFYESPILDASCFLTINPVNPYSTTAPASTTTGTATTTSTSTTVSTFSTTPTTKPTTTLPTTTTSTEVSIPSGCERIEYLIDNPGWADGDDIWNFIFRYKAPTNDYIDWTIKVVFDAEVTDVVTYDAVAKGPYTGGKVWLLTARGWNPKLYNQQMDAIGMSKTAGKRAPNGIAIICNNGVIPEKGLITIGEEAVTDSTTSTLTTTTTTSVTVSVASTISPTMTPDGPTGHLPVISTQTQINFTQSPAGERSPYDLNEVLHKSILFYEAQRSGKLPANNRIPWRGDSGLKDGCYGASSCIDLTGGWYDAGDYVKFGFPMAYSSTVLAWGMLEFQTGYEDAGEWTNALDMLKWATDYFVKAHVSPQELYFQVGDPSTDHSSWGHAETMTMSRPIYKINTSKPGSEVAAETAAALAASSLVFEITDPTYAANLLNHAIQLYQFAWDYRGHYHVSVPKSDVGTFYRSYSGYKDELMWASMWLYKATTKQMYLDRAIEQSSMVSTTEFSWDQKGPGALLLLSEYKSEYKADLYNGIDYVMTKQKTPGGLTHFSDWGSNRYAANFALIALMAAKLEGINTSSGLKYYNYGKEQTQKMLGGGDQSRSYVVGFGVNPPTQPHHRSSSCRSWTQDPTTQVCDWIDRDASGPNPQTLFGALVGGPTLSGYYTDDRSSYVSNEVAVDYNAGFQSAVAGLKYFTVIGRPI